MGQLGVREEARAGMQFGLWQRRFKAYVDSCIGHYIERGYRLVCLKSAASGRKERKERPEPRKLQLAAHVSCHLTMDVTLQTLTEGLHHSVGQH